MKYRYQITLMMLLAIVLILTGCGGGGGDIPVTKGTVKLTIDLPKADSRGIADVSKIRIVCVEGARTLYEETFDFSGNGTISRTCQVPVGANRVFTIDALRANGDVEFTGKSDPVSVQLSPPTELTIILQPPKTDVGVNVIIHEITGPPLIEFTSVPAYGSYDNLKGRVKNVLPGEAKVIVFIQAWIGWWIKPYFTSPYTTIGNDGTWECDITTGGIDETATEILAYLVTMDYVTDSSIPPDPDADPNDQILAKVSVSRSP